VGRRLAAQRAAGGLLLLLAFLLTGCSENDKAEHNPTDVMFAQMTLAQIGEGDQIAVVAEQSATNPQVKALATELRGQWQGESATLQDWLTDWNQPTTADNSQEIHAGHGDLHALQPGDIDGLKNARGSDQDRIAVALLLGNLHNTMETLRMQATGGAYPKALTLAETMTSTRQGQIQRLLALAAG
jgi:uncharacterized protein (DUF305 family)